MSAALAVLTASVRQALPLKRSIMLVVLEVAPAVIYLFATSSRTPTAGFRGVVEIGLSVYFALVVPVVAIVTAAGSLGNERRDLTLSFIALRPMPRVLLAAAKLGSAFLAAWVLNLVGAIALGATHVARYGDGEVVVGLVAGSAAATLAYVSVYVPLGFLTDRAVIIGMAYLLVFENGVVFALSGLAYLSPWRLGVTVFTGVVPEARPIVIDAIGDLASGRAGVAVVVYLAAGLALTTWLLARRDLA